MPQQLTILLIDLAYVIVALTVLLMGKVTLDLLTPFKLDDQVSAKDNPAFGVGLIGYYLGIIIVFVGATYGTTQAGMPLWESILIDVGWAMLGVVLLNVSRILTDRLVFPKFSTRKEIIEDRNVGMGAIECGVYIGSALMVAGAISGQGGGILTALAFWALGQIALIAYAWAYKLATRYDFHGEIERDNVAAGIAYGGNVIAMGIVLMRGLLGDFESWSANLIRFGWYFGFAFVTLLIGRYVVDFVLLPGRTLREEIVEDRNLNAGFLEGGVLMGLAGVICAIL